MKTGKRLMSLALALVMVFSLTTGASAAQPKAEQVSAYFNYNLTVSYGGEARVLTNVKGEQVYPVTYGGTTYVPIRAIGTLLGLKVDWDQETKTALLNDPAEGEDIPRPEARPDSPARKGLEAVTATIEPGITVKYNGVEQVMRTSRGEQVYPMLNGGTIYLPIRAVGNMLGLEVDWSQYLQTAVLTTPEQVKDSGTIGLSVKDFMTWAYIDVDDLEGSRKALREAGYSEEAIESGIRSRIKSENVNKRSQAREAMLDAEFSWSEAQAVVRTLDGGDGLLDYLGAARRAMKNAGLADVKVEDYIRTATDPVYAFNKLQTSADAEKLGEDHVGYDWAEIDWSHAADGYVRVKINEQTTEYTACEVKRWSDHWGRAETYTVRSYDMPIGKWVNIPLTDPDAAYDEEPASELDFVVSLVRKGFTGMTAEEAAAAKNETLAARFVGAPISEEIRWKISNAYADYENAPKTCAKAVEVTKDCKTDAEKITAVFNYVAGSMKYDYKLYNEMESHRVACEAAREKGEPEPEPSRDFHQGYVQLDDVLASDVGICVDYAHLMAGMLRSLGIPCKYVEGLAYSGRKWSGHAWVSVSPDTQGLNKTALGVGTDEDGWLRLDPTWSSTGGAAGRREASIDSNHKNAVAY